MKKTHLNFNSHGFAPKIQSRRMGYQGFFNRSHRSDGGSRKISLKTDGLEGDSLEFAKRLNTAFEGLETVGKEDVEAIIKTTLKGLFGEDGNVNLKFMDEVADLKKELDDTQEGTLKNILKTQGSIITDIKNKINSKVAAGDFEEFEKEFTAEETAKELANIRRNKAGSMAFTIKAAAVTTTTTSVTDSVSNASQQRIGDGPIFTLQRVMPRILEFVSVGNTTASALIWYDEQQKEGDFAVTAEGVAKPLVQYIFVRRSADYEKAAGYTTITEEFDNDYPRVVSTIKRLMQVDCRKAMGTAILADMVSNASAYAYNGMDADIVDPDDYAAIGAAIAQLQTLGYAPNVLVLNPADSWRMRLTKGSDGHYIAAPFTINGSSYEFGQIVVDPTVAAGHFFIGDGSVYNVDLKGDIIVRIGFINDDFIKNQYSMVVEQFYFNYMSTAKKPAFIYASFDTIKADIATV